MLLSLFALTSFCYGQKIYITDTESEADYKIFIEKDFQNNADWIIMKTEWENDAKDGRWFFTDWRNEADLIIFIEDNRNEADKVVYYTEWSTNIKFKLD